MFRGPTFAIESPLGPLELGVVDPTSPGTSAAISRLLFRSIDDARASRGGHLPDWLVADIERNYISPHRVETLWAPKGHRFVVVYDSEIVGTVHITREHDTIFTVDRHRINVSSRDVPGFKPDRHHHVVNLSVKHELRRALIGTRMLDGIVKHFRDLFDGDGLWVRGDPPWHPGLVGLGFVHDPSRDVFLPESVERTSGLTHAELNARYACTCAPVSPERARRLEREKLQYVSFTRSFTAAPALRPPPQTKPFRVMGRGFASVGRPSSPDPGSSSGHPRHPTRVRFPENEPGSGVRVGAGVAWQDVVRALAPERRLPPVLTSWLAATVGGTLSTGGFSKGSHRYGLQIDHVTELVVVTGDGRTVTCGPKQAAWLFDAVLGGWGRFGVILEATLPLIDHPPRLDVVSTRVSDALALRDALEAAAAADATYHVTSYRAADGAWVVVTASASDTGTTTLESYVDPERPSAPLPEQLWLHLFAPSATLPELLTAFTDVLRADDGDKVQVIPVRKMREHRASFVRLPDVPVGSLVHAVLVTREVRQRDRAALDAETRELDALARTLGATSTLAGTLPRDEAEWRAHLGASADDVARTLRVADPDGVLLGDGATTFKQ